VKAVAAGRQTFPGAAGTWKDLTGNVNLLLRTLTSQFEPSQSGHGGDPGRPQRVSSVGRHAAKAALKTTSIR